MKYALAILLSITLMACGAATRKMGSSTSSGSEIGTNTDVLNSPSGNTIDTTDEDHPEVDPNKDLRIHFDSANAYAVEMKKEILLPAEQLKKFRMQSVVGGFIFLEMNEDGSVQMLSEKSNASNGCRFALRLRNNTDLSQDLVIPAGKFTIKVSSRFAGTSLDEKAKIPFGFVFDVLNEAGNAFYPGVEDAKMGLINLDCSGPDQNQYTDFLDLLNKGTKNNFNFRAID